MSQVNPVRIVNFEITSPANSQSALPVLSYTSDVVFLPKELQSDALGNLLVQGDMRSVDGSYLPAAYLFDAPKEGWADLEGEQGFALVRFDAFGGMHDPVRFVLERVGPSDAPSPVTH